VAIRSDPVTTGLPAAAVAATLRLLAVGWWLQLKMRSRSAFDGILAIVYPMFFATSVLLMYRQGGSASALVGAAVGASVLGVWSAVATTASTSLQQERRLGTLELLVAAPRPFPLVVVPMTMAMGTIGLYSLLATLLWGRFAFGIPLSLEHPLVFVLASVATAIGVSLMGFLLAVSAVRYRGAWALGTAFEFPVWLVCGFLVPVASLPDWVAPISWLLPPTWGAAAIRDAAFGGSPWSDIALCLALSLLYGAVGTWLCGRLVTSARTNATLALT
jgi:ABC-2 type transport system permease protein